MVPTNLRYTKDHEWVALDGEIATTGITDFAQGQLGDIVYIELPATGRTVAKGESLGTIESVKAVSEVYAPLSGTIVETNGALGEHPEQVNREPHGSGWLCKIRISDPSEVTSLLTAADYEGLAQA